MFASQKSWLLFSFWRQLFYIHCCAWDFFTLLIYLIGPYFTVCYTCVKGISTQSNNCAKRLNSMIQRNLGQSNITFKSFTAMNRLTLCIILWLFVSSFWLFREIFITIMWFLKSRFILVIWLNYLGLKDKWLEL